MKLLGACSWVKENREVHFIQFRLVASIRTTYMTTTFADPFQEKVAIEENGSFISKKNLMRLSSKS
jgi:hypothetical protein